MKRYCTDCKAFVEVVSDFSVVEHCAKCESTDVRLTLRQRMALVEYFKCMHCPSVEIAPGQMRRGDVWFLDDPTMGGAVLHRPTGNGLEYWDWNELDVKSILGHMFDDESLDRVKEPRWPKTTSWFMRDDGAVLEMEKWPNGTLHVRTLPDGSSFETSPDNAGANWSCLVDGLAKTVEELHDKGTEEVSAQVY